MDATRSPVDNDVRRHARTFVSSIARTNVQLYNQLVVQQRPDSELLLIRRAYDLSSQLYSAAYHGDGKPFVLHGVTIASAVALLGLPSRIVATALLHNVYVNADFGDGLQRRVTSRRRRLVVDAVGDEVEALIRRFAELRLEHRLDQLLARAPQMDETDRDLLTMDLADLLEKLLDGGALYIGQNEWVLGFATRRENDLIGLAALLDRPVLGEALRLTIAELSDRTVPAVLRSGPHRKYMAYFPPLSYWPRPVVVLQRWRARLIPAARRLLRGDHTASVAREPAD